MEHRTRPKSTPTRSVGLYSFIGLYKSSPHLIQAAAMITMAIPIAVFVFGQRFFMRGIDLSGALK